MSYINTALINKLSKEVEDIMARLKVLESATKPQQKVGKITTSEAKYGLSGAPNVLTNGVAKGAHQIEPQDSSQTLLKDTTDD